MSSSKGLEPFRELEHLLIRGSDELILIEDVCSTAVDLGLASAVRILQKRSDHLVCVASSGPTPAGALFWELHAVDTHRLFVKGDQSALIVPLVVRDAIWGCLAVYRSANKMLTPEHQGEWRAFAGDLALTLERRETAKRLAESERFVRDLGNLVPGLFFKLAMDSGGKLTFRYLSPGIDLLLPYSAQQVMDNASLLLGAVHPSDRVRLGVIALRSRRALTVFNLEFRLRRPNGMVVWILATAFPQREGRDDVVWTGMAIDVTSQNRLQEALQREQDLLKVVLETMGDGVAAINEKGEPVLLNRTAQRLLGSGGKPSEAVLRSWPWNARDRFHPWFLKRPDGTAVHLEVQASDLSEPGHPPRGLVLLLRDMTDHDRYEERFRRSEKLESIGLLAGGIAHDFNNLLTGLFGFIELAMLHADDPSRVLGYLEQARAPFQRARSLTGQLLTFAKSGEVARTRVDVEAVLRPLATFLFQETSIAPLLEVDGAPSVLANEVEFHQVLENLLINARQALDESDEPRLVVTVKAETVTAESFRGLEPGDYVVLSVWDNGPGVASEHRLRIFDPFFSTKTGGTGLGLSICHSIVKKHGGSIDLVDVDKPGARFRVLWPAASGDNGS